jgi:ABC-2 type transport system permease protein
MSAPSMPVAPAALGGAVYDRGYRPYDGPRGGRGSARWALWRLSVRRALGIRRSWRQKVLPWTLLGLVTIPAIVSVGIRWATRQSDFTEGVELDAFLTFYDYVDVSSFLFLFVAVAAPDIVCPDRHDRVLPLIFSRSLTGIDYIVAKVGAIAAILFGFAFVPQVVLFVGEMLVSGGGTSEHLRTSDGALDYLGDNAEYLWQVPLAVALLAIYYAVISVAVSSLTDRRIVAAIAFLGIVLISASVAGVLIDATDNERSLAALFSVIEPPRALRDLVFLGHMADGMEPGLDSVSPLSGIEGSGLLAVLVYLLIVAVGVWVLLWRYREVEL